MKMDKKIISEYSILFFYCTLLSILTGWAISFFLHSLDIVTSGRWEFPYIIYFLPLAGIIIYITYTKWLGKYNDGNQAIINDLTNNSLSVRPALTPLVYAGTILTHLFGGSAGREGTAIQMGAGIGALLSKKLNLNIKTRNYLLRAGVSAGFAAVFGTPIAGTIFAFEFLRQKKINYKALLLCLYSSILAHLTTISTGTIHSEYEISPLTTFHIFGFSCSVKYIFISMVTAIVFGGCALLYKKFIKLLKTKIVFAIKREWMRPVIGGILLLTIALLLPINDYLGLGVLSQSESGVSITEAFSSHSIPYYAFLIKMILTAITLSFGFKGGEVTPMFFIGATLGNSLGMLMHMYGVPLSLSFLVGLGFVSVFAAASKTPLTSSVLGVEIFGMENALYFFIACFTANFFSGKKSIYN